MNIIAAYVIAKENLNLEIAKKTAELYLDGMTYKEALEKAKRMFQEKWVYSLLNVFLVNINCFKIKFLCRFISVATFGNANYYVFL